MLSIPLAASFKKSADKNKFRIWPCSFPFNVTPLYNVVSVGVGNWNGSAKLNGPNVIGFAVSNLTVFIDYNKLQSYGLTKEVLDLEPLADKWKSFGFEVVEVDGHDVIALEAVLKKLPINKEKPTTIICHTIKSKGFPYAEGRAEWHHKSNMKSEEIAQMYKCLE